MSEELSGGKLILFYFLRVLSVVLGIIGNAILKAKSLIDAKIAKFQKSEEVENEKPQVKEDKEDKEVATKPQEDLKEKQQIIIEEEIIEEHVTTEEREITKTSKSSECTTKVEESNVPKEEVKSENTKEEDKTFDEKTLTKRKYAIEELVTSESNYRKYLDVLVGTYKPALEQLLQPDQIRLIFGNLDPLRMLSLQFQQLFEREAAKGPKDAVVGTCFENIKHFIKIFVPFIEHYPEVEMEVQRLLRENKRVATACEQIEKTGQQPLTSLIVMPVQRMPKYVLLLREVLKATPAWHPDSKLLEDAMAQMQEASKSADAKSNEAKQKAELFLLQTTVKNCPTLVSPTRRLIGRYPLAADKEELVVLTDMLLVLKRKTAIVGPDFFQFKRDCDLRAAFGAERRDGEIVVTLANGGPISIPVAEGADEVLRVIRAQIDELQSFQARIRA